jgi:hypothetical protein
MVLSPAGLRIKNNCAGEGQQQFTRHQSPVVTRPVYFLGGSNGERSYHGLEPIHVTTKLTKFPGLSLQGEQILPLQIYFQGYKGGKNRCHLSTVYTYIYIQT